MDEGKESPPVNSSNFLLPGYNYCGSGQNVGAEPVDALDAACELHDMAYDAAVSDDEMDVADEDLYEIASSIGDETPSTYMKFKANLVKAAMKALPHTRALGLTRGKGAAAGAPFKDMNRNNIFDSNIRSNRDFTATTPLPAPKTPSQPRYNRVLKKEFLFGQEEKKPDNNKQEAFHNLKQAETKIKKAETEIERNTRLGLNEFNFPVGVNQQKARGLPSNTNSRGVNINNGSYYSSRMANRKRKTKQKSIKKLAKAEARVVNAVAKSLPSKVMNMKLESNPASYDVKIRLNKPEYKSLGGKGFAMRVKNVEPIGSFGTFTSSGVPYTYIQGAYINPGNSALFPWLSQIALQFEKYKFNYIKIHYRPVCPTSTSGVVGMCIDYDPADAFVSSVYGWNALSGFQPFVEGNVYKPLVYTSTKDLNNDRSRSYRYVKPMRGNWGYTYYNTTTAPTTVTPTAVASTGSSALGESIHDWCNGLLYIANNYGTSTSNITTGELFIEYDLILDGKTNEFQGLWSKVVSTTTTVANPLSAGTNNISGPLGVIIGVDSASSNDVIELPAGNYVVAIATTGTGLSTTVGYALKGNNGSFVGNIGSSANGNNLYLGVAGTWWQDGTGNTINVYQVSIPFSGGPSTMNANAPNQNILVVPVGPPTTISKMTIYILATASQFPVI